MRIKASSVPNRYFARAFASCVFPTPVGPKKIKEPTGCFGDAIPARLLRIAPEIILTASSCPITVLWSSSSIWMILSVSLEVICSTGMPVISQIIFSMS